MSQSNQAEAPGPPVTQRATVKPVQERGPCKECDGKHLLRKGDVPRTYSGPLASMKTGMDAAQRQPLFDLTLSNTWSNLLMSH